MAESFEKQLEKVAGTTLPVYVDDYHHRFQNGLLYYFDKADKLRKAAETLFAHLELNEPAIMLAGMALEVLLKGTARALDNPSENNHRLNDLAQHIGICVSGDEAILLRSMSEHIYWAGRYTAPLKDTDLENYFRLQDTQRRASGTLADRDIPTRTVSAKTFGQLWAKFAHYFWVARDARLESATSRYGREPN